MQEDAILIAKQRDLKGSSNARRMRKAGLLPGVIYAEGKEASPVELNMHDFEQLLHHHASETMIVEVEVEGEGKISALIKDVQHHPVTGDLVHVDLQEMDAKVAIQVEISIEPVGEPAGVKAGGSLDLVMHALEVECLPGDLIETIEVDVSNLEMGDHLRVADLNIDKRFKVLGDEEAIVVAVSSPRVEEDSEEEGAGSAEPEVITEKKADGE